MNNNEKILVKDLLEVAKIVGCAPTQDQYKKYGNININEFLKIQGWKKWQDKLPKEFVRTNSMKIDENDLIEDLIYVKNIIRKIPSINDHMRYGKYSIPVFRRIKSWTKWLEDVFGVKNMGIAHKKISNEDLINNLLELKEKLGKIPRKVDIPQGKYSINAYKRAFGNLANSLLAAGLKPNQIRGMPKEQLLEELQQVYEKLGHTPTMEEFSKYANLASINVVYSRFKSWTNALKAANIPIMYQSNISKEDIIIELKKWYEEHNSDVNYLGYWEIRLAKEAHKFPYCCTTISHKFNEPWEKIMKRIDPNYETINHYTGRGSFTGLDENSYISDLERRTGDILFNMKNNNSIIDYEYEAKVCDDKMWTCDFKVQLNNGIIIWIEGDGMEGRRKTPYNSGENEKINYYNEHNFNLLIVKIKHNIEKKINDFIGELL